MPCRFSALRTPSTVINDPNADVVIDQIRQPPLKPTDLFCGFQGRSPVSAPLDDLAAPPPHPPQQPTGTARQRTPAGKPPERNPSRTPEARHFTRFADGVPSGVGRFQGRIGGSPGAFTTYGTWLVAIPPTRPERYQRRFTDSEDREYRRLVAMDTTGSDSPRKPTETPPKPTGYAPHTYTTALQTYRSALQTHIADSQTYRTGV